MSAPEYAEYRMTPELPPAVELCPRCRRGVLIFLGIGDGHPFTQSGDRPDGWCYVCGFKGRGVVYRAGEKR